MKKIGISLSALVLWVAGFTQNLNQQEKDAILYMREEEKLARDVYDSLYVKWSGNPFGNIRQSEQVHMDRVKSLLSSYNLSDPIEKNKDKHGLFENSILQKYYNELIASGSQSLTAALKAGAKIEELDIADLDLRINQTQRQDIISVFNYLKSASENHLRAFVRRLKMEGVNYEPVLLDKAQFDKIIAAKNTMGGHGPGGRRGE